MKIITNPTQNQLRTKSTQNKTQQKTHLAKYKSTKNPSHRYHGMLVVAMREKV